MISISISKKGGQGRKEEMKGEKKEEKKEKRGERRKKEE